MHQSHLSIFIVEPRFVEKLANAFPILFTPTKLLALLFWEDAGHSFLCTGTQIQRSGVQFIAGFPDLIHVQFPVTVQWTSFFKINIYALISGLIINNVYIISLIINLWEGEIKMLHASKDILPFPLLWEGGRWKLCFQSTFFLLLIRIC